MPATWSPFIALGAFVVAVAAASAARAADPLSPEAMAARIRAHRSADVTLTVTDAAGKPVAGRKVTVRMVRHKFLFGCNFFALRPADQSAPQKAYQKRYTDLLNYATLPFYWGAFERREGTPDTDRLRAMAQWCRDHGLRTKGHPLCWHEVKPRWLEGKSLEEVKRLQLGRITREVTGFQGLIDMWDVVNEAVRMPGYELETNQIGQLCHEMGNVALIKETVAAARKANPKATLLLNDYDTSPNYEALIRKCLAAGAAIDVVGIQSHMHGGYWGAAKAWEVCERFARFGKPLHFTELTIISGPRKENMKWQGRYDDWASTPDGEAEQARQVAEFYRVLFSHPAVEAVTWWDFSDAGAWLGAPSGLVRKDMSPKPAYEALMAMVRKEWWTGPLQLETDAAGAVRFRGFLGDYAVQSDGAAATVAILSAGKAEVIAKLTGGRE